MNFCWATPKVRTNFPATSLNAGLNQPRGKLFQKLYLKGKHLLSFSVEMPFIFPSMLT
jgi:hypothetical protein